MHKDPQKRVDVRKTPGKLTLIVFALCVVAALCCDYMLFAVRRGEASAVSGELIQGGYGSVPSSVWGRLFEYFGSVTYLFPLMALLPIWWLLRSGFSLRNLDFFRIGLRLVGFNVLVLGLCMLYCGILGSDSNDAGGYVGIGLYQFVFAVLPRLAAALLIIFMTFAGLMLFCAHGPIWFCDHIGAAVSALLPFKGKTSAQSEKADANDAEQPASDDKAPLETFKTVSVSNESMETVSAPQDAESKTKAKSFVAPRFFRGKADADARLTVGHAQGGRVEPSFGGMSAASAAKEASNPQEVKPRQTPYAGENASQSELDLWGTQARAVSGQAASGDLPQEQRSSSPAPESAPTDPRTQGPSTIISGGAYATQEPSEEELQGYPEDEYVMPDAPSSTIITKAGEDQAAPGVPEREAQSAAAPSSPLYQAGAPGVDSDVVGNPFRRGSVSTVITRHDPSQDMQFDQQVKGGESEGHADGYYTEKDSGAYIPPAPGTLMEKQRESTDVPGYFSFEQEPEKEDSVPAVRTSLRRGESGAPISEHDSAYLGSFGRATRGLADPQPEEEAVVDDFPQSGISQGFDDPARDYDGYEDEPAEADDQEQSDFFGGDAAASEIESDDYAESSDPVSADQEFAPPQDPPHAPLGRVPTRNYVSSITTVPSGSDPHDNWRPPFDLLTPPRQSEMVEQATIDAMIVRINKALTDFGVEAEVASYLAGPVITRYDLRLGRGTRVSAIRNLQLDLARTLTTAQVRVLDMIPGTPFAGLEIPNPKRKIITLREVVETDDFAHTGAGLPLCLGVNTTGAPVVADLAKAPHLLIAGTTGSGKSAGINSMLISLLLTRSPSELRMILVDPKQVEFALYQDLPHLICPVISEPAQTMAALQWCVSEMERRYKLISGLRLRSIGEVNQYIESENAQGMAVYDPAWTADMGGSPAVLKPIPSIVMVIDEFADLMDAFRAKPKGNRGIQPDVLVGRLAQKARAAGIHLMLATQSPRSQVITGTLKANLPSRIAFTVQSALDSRVILDESGAETLLGNGDMLAKLMGLMNNQLFRAHGPFTSNEDVQAVVNAWHEHCGEPEFVEGVTDVEDEEEGDDASFGGEQQSSRKKDILYDQVVAYARDHQNTHDGANPSLTSIQSEFGIGYPRAHRLVMEMKRNGDLRND